MASRANYRALKFNPRLAALIPASKCRALAVHRPSPTAANIARLAPAGSRAEWGVPAREAAIESRTLLLQIEHA